MLHAEDTRKYPVLVEQTSVKVVWVDAPSHAEALNYAACDPWDHDGEYVDIGGYEVRIPDEWEHQLIVSDAPAMGPARLCLTCGVEVWGGPDTPHHFRCPDRPKYERGGGWIGPAEVTRSLGQVFEQLMPGGPGWGVGLDVYEIELTISPATDAEWSIWCQLAGIDHKTVRELRTFRYAQGELAPPATGPRIRTVLIAHNRAGQV